MTVGPLQQEHLSEKGFSLIDLKHEKRFQEQKQLDPIVPGPVSNEMISNSVEL